MFLKNNVSNRIFLVIVELYIIYKVHSFQNYNSLQSTKISVINLISLTSQATFSVKKIITSVVLIFTSNLKKYNANKNKSKLN